MNPAVALRLFGLWCRINGVLGADRPGQLALDKFLQAPKPTIRPAQAEFLAKARWEKLDFRGVPFATYSWGPADAPYVYTAYGWGYNAGRWRHFAPRILDAGYRLVAFDYLGHGHSAGRDMDYPSLVDMHLRVIEHFGKPALALTHSFGAGTFMDVLALLSPEQRPDRVALLASFSHVAFVFRQYAAALGFAERHYESLDRAVQRRTGRSLSSFDPAVSSQVLAETPVLIAHDPADAVTEYSNAERIAEHWPNALLLPTPGAEHNFSDAAINECVLDWLLDGQVPELSLRGHATLRPCSSITHGRPA